MDNMENRKQPSDLQPDSETQKLRKQLEKLNMEIKGLAYSKQGNSAQDIAKDQNTDIIGEMEKSIKASEIAMKLATGSYSVSADKLVKKWFGEK